ncbi:MAG: hypothetical protein KC652_08610 [Cyanobacteria bacterium HKST-UBA01]|nr:hypothetical protein [Cyanobacteria bacterium HKST-UBA01]
MINGILTVNFDPPYLCFQRANETRNDTCLRDCSREEIRNMLLKLGAHHSTPWPIDDCIIRSKGSFSQELLEDFDLAQHIPFKTLKKASVSQTRRQSA